MMIFSMLLSTSLFAGQESGGNEGTIYLVSPIKRNLIQETSRVSESRKFSAALNLDIQSRRNPAAISTVISSNAIISRTVVLDIDF